MIRRFRCLVVIVIATLGTSALADPPAPPGNSGTSPVIPVGNWKIKFTNGVIEKCMIRQDGSASVVEPLRSAPGKPMLEDGTFVIQFNDDRTERWSPVGKKMIVEHWCPSSRYPNGERVLGIGKKLP